MGGVLIETVTCLDTNLLAFAIKQHHETAKHSVVTPECFERSGEGCFEIACVRKQSTDLEQRAKFPHLAPFARNQFRTLSVGSNHDGWRMLECNSLQVKVKTFIAR